MKPKQYEIWLVDLNPQIGTEPGKVRTVVVVQTNLLNKIEHPSTIICPITTNVIKDAEVLRVHLKKGVLKEASDIMVDQIRAIDNKRLIKKLGEITPAMVEKLKENILICLDLEL